MNLPIPKESTINLKSAGVSHRNPYTDTYHSAVTFGTRKLWNLVYNYGIMDIDDAKALQAIVKASGNGISTIPLYYPHRADIPAIANTYGNVITAVDGNEITLDQVYGFIPGDLIQVGDYALHINSINGNDIVVDNMPHDLDDLPDSTQVTTHPYHIKGRNGDFGFEITRLDGIRTETPLLILTEVV